MKQTRLFLVGYMGCGKTHTAKRLAKKYGMDYIDLDQYIERRFFKTIPQIFAERGEEGFASGETVYLQASPEGLFAYLKNAKAERPLLAGKSDDEMLAFIRTSLETREPYYLKAKHVIDSKDESDVLFDQLLK